LHIPIEGDIDRDMADAVSDQLSDALGDPAVAGIVLRIDSPGGSAVDSERIYVEVLRARERKPLVAMIDGEGESGAYFVAVAAEKVFATSLSAVGNVGVWRVARSDPPPDEDLLVSGPHKLSAASEEEQVRQLEIVRQRFLQAVLSQRADQLGPNAQLLPRGEAYLGVEALKLGLVDKIGTLADADRLVAERAGVHGQRVRSASSRTAAWVSVLSKLLVAPAQAGQATGGER
jgi:ClpP class serine protease